MRRLIIHIILLTSFAACCSCSDMSENMSAINSFLTDHLGQDKLDSIKYIVVIPEQGCGGCISVAETFYHDFSNRNDILFVFSNILSVKMLNHKLDINKDNTVIDSENVYMNILPRKNRIYPNAIIMKDGKAAAIIAQSKDESGLRVLRHHLEENINH